tara:strand:+ start:2779 stop:2952 length:174 start_codon:yes stop_codon:yes gene_type:complete
VERHNIHINKGVELILRGEPKPKEEKNTWEVSFGKLVSLFKREYDFFFKVSLNIRKK